MKYPLKYPSLCLVACALLAIGCGSAAVPSGLPQISSKVNPRFAVTALLFLKEVEGSARLADVTSNEEQVKAQFSKIYDAWADVPDDNRTEPANVLWASCRVLVGQSRKLMQAREAAKTDPSKQPELALLKSWTLESVTRVRKAIADGESLLLTEPAADAVK